MKALHAVLVLAMLLLVAPASAEAGKRISMAVLPTVVKVEEPPKDWDAGDYVRDEIIAGMNRVARFNVMDGADVTSALEAKKITVESLDTLKAAEVAKLLKKRLVLLPKIDLLKLERRTEELLIIKRQTVVCRASVSGVLYDAATGRSVTLGPYPFEEKKMGSGGTRHKQFELTDEDARKLAKTCLAAGARDLRSRIYKLYPLVGKVSSVVGEKMVIDIGKDMGVKPGHIFAVTATVEQENPITGLKERVRREVARVVVEKVGAEASACRILRGKKDVAVGGDVKRVIKD